MSPDEIISELTRVQRRVPAVALQAAEEHRTELTPLLLTCLAEVIANPQLLEDKHDLELPFYAMYLLAAWREPTAHPLFLSFLRLPGDQPVALSGDIVTQDMDRMLAQTCGGDVTGIVSLAGDTGANESARGAAVSALALLATWGEVPKETVAAYYRAMIAAGSSSASGVEPDTALTEIVGCALDLQLNEMRDELVALYDNGRIDDLMISRQELIDEFGHVAPRPRKLPLTDVADAVRWWRCFERLPRPAWREPAPQPASRITPAPPYLYEAPVPFRAPPKVGRNDPCPCGSGKKFKKCCGQ